MFVVFLESVGNPACRAGNGEHDFPGVLGHARDERQRRQRHVDVGLQLGATADGGVLRRARELAALSGVFVMGFFVMGFAGLETPAPADRVLARDPTQLCSARYIRRSGACGRQELIRPASPSVAGARPQPGSAGRGSSAAVVEANGPQVGDDGDAEAPGDGDDGVVADGAASEQGAHGVGDGGEGLVLGELPEPRISWRKRQNARSGNDSVTAGCSSRSTPGVFHCFEKKTRQTPKADIDLARQRYRLAIESIRAKERP